MLIGVLKKQRRSDDYLSTTLECHLLFEWPFNSDFEIHFDVLHAKHVKKFLI